MNLAGGDAGKADDPGRVARQRERVEPDRLRLTLASVATESVNQPLIKKSDRLRLTRASVATESVNRPLIKESDRLRLTRASVATQTYRDLTLNPALGRPGLMRVKGSSAFLAYI